MSLTLHSGDSVLVHSATSHFDGLDGRVMAPEPDGGFVVALDGGCRCHFEPSELELVGRPFVSDEVLLAEVARYRAVLTDVGLVMTKCCAHGCPNTAALQPGSSYLCPDHGDGGCSDTIIKGDHS